jgi:RNA polymerase sigma factor (sigma-70 family)
MSESDGPVREAAAGNAAAFGVLVRLHQAKLRGFLLRMTKGNHALADDLAQETFIEAYRKIGQFGRGSFFGWLCAIAYSRYLMEARKKKLEPLDEGRDMADLAPEPETASLARLDLEKAMGRLSPAQRAALTLCFALGFSHEEAATALDVPLGTLKSNVNRGREKLAAMLGVWRNMAVP